MCTCLAGPPLKPSSSALQSMEEMTLAWEDSMAGVSLGLPSLEDRDSSLQECWRKHVLLYMGQLEFILAGWNSSRLRFKNCI